MSTGCCHIKSTVHPRDVKLRRAKHSCLDVHTSSVYIDHTLPTTVTCNARSRWRPPFGQSLHKGTCPGERQVLEFRLGGLLAALRCLGGRIEGRIVVALEEADITTC